MKKRQFIPSSTGRYSLCSLLTEKILDKFRFAHMRTCVKTTTHHILKEKIQTSLNGLAVCVSSLSENKTVLLRLFNRENLLFFNENFKMLKNF